MFFSQKSEDYESDQIVDGKICIYVEKKYISEDSTSFAVLNNSYIVEWKFKRRNRNIQCFGRMCRFCYTGIRSAGRYECQHVFFSRDAHGVLINAQKRTRAMKNNALRGCHGEKYDERATWCGRKAAATHVCIDSRIIRERRNYSYVKVSKTRSSSRGVANVYVAPFTSVNSRTENFPPYRENRRRSWNFIAASFED